MLYGPPGTGKTFAVEALAEHLQRPLMKLSPASLEIHPQIIDIALHEEKMLDICQRWGAIVLIDDASELLELLDGKRSVAFYIVLRHLKYPKTVIFLTSHNVGIDVS
jgi:SpoVK/Ycf46/Vps4 family AAA+-type ATPase